MMNRVLLFSKTPGGREVMSELMNEIITNRIRQTKFEIAIKLLKMNLLSHEEISKATELTIEEIQELAELIENQV